MTRITSALKRHGGKFYLAPKLVELAPPRDSYCHLVETNFGSGAFMLAHDPQGISEVANDLDEELTNFWRVLQHSCFFGQFQRAIEATPFSSKVFNKALAELESGEVACQITRAVNFFIVNRQSRQGIGKDFATLSRNRVRSGMNEQVSAWLNAVEGLPELHARLKRVVITCMDMKDLIRQQDGKKTLFYMDPPYLHETRNSTGEYKHEMSDVDHFLLLTLLSRVSVLKTPELMKHLLHMDGGHETYDAFKELEAFRMEGKFILSGYHSKLYDDFARMNDWQCVEFDLPNNASSSESKERKIECAWTNY
jgi:DNA adenine methylase